MAGQQSIREDQRWYSAETCISSHMHNGVSGTEVDKGRVGWANTLALNQPDAIFKQHRRNIVKVAGASTSLTVFDRIQNEEAAHFLLNVLDSPNNLFEHIRKEAGAVILRITYGYTPNAQGRDPLVDMAGQAMVDFTEASAPGKWAVDVLPFREQIDPLFPQTWIQS